jgi:hypothetical protein
MDKWWHKGNAMDIVKTMEAQIEEDISDRAIVNMQINDHSTLLKVRQALINAEILDSRNKMMSHPALNNSSPYYHLWIPSSLLHSNTDYWANVISHLMRMDVILNITTDDVPLSAETNLSE